jgi:hypothetical protein
MIIKEQNEFAKENEFPFFHSDPINRGRFLHRKTITYDADPEDEIQEMIDDGWTLEQRELSTYYNTEHYTITMIKYADELDPSIQELPIPPDNELRHQVSKLFENRWATA